MQKIKFLVLLVCLISAPICMANECINNIKDHYKDYKDKDEPSQLWLDKCALTDADMPAVADFLNAHSDIKIIDLESNQIGDTGAYYLSKTSLQDIFADDNKIGDEGAIALSKMENLHMLSVSKSQIGDVGADALAHSKHLQALDIRMNKITDASMKAFALNETICMYSFAKDDIHDVGALEFANKHNIVLHDLDFRRDPLSHDAIETLKKNKDIHFLQTDESDSFVKLLASHKRAIKSAAKKDSTNWCW